MKLLIAPGATNTPTQVHEDCILIDQLTYQSALKYFGGMQFKSVEIVAGAMYEPNAIQFALSRVRKPVDRPLFGMFDTAALMPKHGLGELQSGMAERQASELARRIENWLKQSGVTNDDVGKYKIVQIESLVTPHTTLYQLQKLDGTVVSQLTINMLTLHNQEP